MLGPPCVGSWKHAGPRKFPVCKMGSGDLPFTSQLHSLIHTKDMDCFCCTVGVVETSAFTLTP